ncbi:MAG: tandem-95 repeat protein [Bacteroidota bacterium]
MALTMSMSFAVSHVAAQDFTFDVTVSDGAVATTITLGLSAAAPNDAGFDAGLDVQAPPPPPFGAFDARLTNETGDFLTDIRSSASGTTTFDVEYQASSGAGPIMLSWDSAAIQSLGEFEIVDAITGALFGPLDMSTVATLNVSTAGGLLPNRLRIRVTPIVPPIAVDDPATTAEDAAVLVNVLANDTDVDGRLDVSTVTIVTAAANGTALANADGTITYTPAADFNGTDSFSYTVNDYSGATSNAATVTVTVTAVNDVPTVTDDSATTLEDIAVAINVLANDADVDGTLDTSTVTVFTAATGGTALANADGTITYTPAADFNGADSFSYTVNDDSGATSNAATVTVTVTAVNDVPIAIDDPVTTAEDAAVLINVLANDADVDGTLDVSTVTIVTTAANGTALANADGTITYTPAADFNGTDSFSYTVNDDSGATSNVATVTITVSATQDDADGIPDEEEDNVDGDGNGEPDGDGNNDGIRDKEQDEVASARIDGSGAYVTLQAPMGTTLLAPSATQTIPDATAPEAPMPGETAAVFQFGIDLDPSASGSCDASVDVELILPPGALANRYFKYGPTPDNAADHWYEYPNVTTRTDAQGRIVLLVTLADGQAGDNDLSANCIIQDRGAAVFRERVANESEEDLLPQQFSLQQNYPNPFNPTTSITFAVPEAAFVTVAVYNMLGEQVATVVAESLAPGRYQHAFDARDLASGLYIYRMSAKSFSATRMMTLMK